MKLYTIGFTKKNAEQFFGKLKQAGLTRIIDTRLNNVSQLAGFTKKDDLRFFAKEILGVDYVHIPSLAPTKDILAFNYPHLLLPARSRCDVGEACHAAPEYRVAGWAVGCAIQIPAETGELQQRGLQ